MDKDLYFILAKLSVRLKDVNVNNKIFYIVQNVMGPIDLAKNK